jgi:predicted dehydrogenase
MSSPTEPVRVGVVGCGDISAEYLRGCAMFDVLDVVACADLDPERAASMAAEFQVPRTFTPDELLGDQDVELVLNLTPPKAHAAVSRAAIDHGKHVYSEKPLATSREDAESILVAARGAGVRVGTAPDTFLGGGLQTSLKLIDDGWIGTPVAATAFVASHGYEHFHPRVEFFYDHGGGPMLDVGPYYVTALVALLGPVARVSGSATRRSDVRVLSKAANRRTEIPVRVATHVAGTLDFHCGAVVSLVASWEVWSHGLPFIEVYGTEGSISVPNPDMFGGEPRVRRPREQELQDDPPRDSASWNAVPLTHRADVARGVGVADLADGLRAGAAHRCSGELARHVLDVLLAFEQSSEEGRHVEIEHSCERPRPLPPSVVGAPMSFGR